MGADAVRAEIIIATLKPKETRLEINEQIKKFTGLRMLKLTGQLDTAKTRDQIKKQLGSGRGMSSLEVKIGKINAKSAIKDLKAQINQMLAQLDVSNYTVSLNPNVEGQLDLKKATDDTTDSFDKQSDAADKALKKQTNLVTQRLNLEAQLLKYRAANPGANNLFDTRFAGIEQILSSPDGQTELGLARVRELFAGVKKDALEAGVAGNTFLSQIKEGIAKFGGWTFITRGVAAAIRTTKDIIKNVIELDSAMTELKKVTDETDAVYSKFLDNAGVRAKALGATLVDTINATADFARLGFNIPDSENLADAALVYKNVGDGIKDVGEASSSIISTIKAFGIEADNAISIVDKFNEVGNNFAITSQGIGEAIKRSASALAAANNTLDESIGLSVAMNNVIQDPVVVGTSLRTISMRLRNTAGELEILGEDAEGAAESITQLQTKLLNLTSGKVNIFEADNATFKSTYQIVSDIAQVWGTLKDVQQAEVTRLVAGIRQANAWEALMSGFKDMQSATETSASSAGSALKENDIYLSSIKGKLDVLQATFEDLSLKLVDNDSIKVAVDAMAVFLDVIGSLVEVFSSLPTVIGLATGAMTLFSSKFNGIVTFRKGETIGDMLGIGDKSLNQLKRQVSEAHSIMGLFAKNVSKAPAVDVSEVEGIFELFSEYQGKSAEEFAAFTSIVEENNASLGAFFREVGQAGTASMEGYTNSVNAASAAQAAMTTTSHGAAIAAKALRVALNAFVTMAVFAGIQLLITGITKLVQAEENHRKEMENLEAAYNQQTRSLESISGELDKIVARITELQGKGALTIVEQGELEKLQDITKEMRIQQDITRREADNAARDLADKAAKAFRSRVKKGGDSPDTLFQDYQNISMEDFEPGRLTEGVVKAAARYRSFSEMAQNFAEEWEKANKAGDEVKKSELEVSRNLAKMNQDNLFDDLEGRLIAVNEEIRQMAVLSEEARIDFGIEDAYQGAVKTRDFIYSIIDSTSYKMMGLNDFFTANPITDYDKKLKALAIQGKLTSDELDSSAYKSLRGKMQELGLTTEELVQHYIALANSMSVAEQQAVLSINTTDMLANSITRVTAGIEVLGSAYSEMDSSGQLSLDTVVKLMKAHDNWVDLIDISNGMIKLNAQVSRDSASVVIQAEIDKLETTNRVAKGQVESLNKVMAAQISTAALMVGIESITAWESVRSTVSNIDMLNASISGTQKTIDVLTNLLNSDNPIANIGKAASGAKSEVDKLSEALKLRGNAALADLDRRKEALQDELDLLNAQYDAEDKLFKMEQARDRYEAAKANLNTRLYTKEKGWIWVADPAELNSAKEALEELHKEQERETARKAIQDEIDAIDKMRKEWQDAIANIGKSWDAHMADLEAKAEFEKLTLDDMGNAYHGFASEVEAAMKRVAAAESAARAKVGWDDSSPTKPASATKNPVTEQSKKPVEDWKLAKWGIIPGYSSGGVVSHTGLAEMHGSKTNPETVFNATDSKKLYEFVHSTPNLISALVEEIKGKMSLLAAPAGSQAEQNGVTFRDCTFKLDLPNVNSPGSFLPELYNIAKQNIRW